jgi:hypothetical protein
LESERMELRDPDEKNGSPERRYPRFYEKVVPIALGVVATAILILLLLIAAVALGLIPGG